AMELDEYVGYITDEESVTSKHEALDPAHANDARSLNEELSYEEDLDEWLKGELEKHMRIGKDRIKFGVNGNLLSSNSPIKKVYMETLVRKENPLTPSKKEGIRSHTNLLTPSTTTVSDKCPYKTNYPTPVLIDEWDIRYHIIHTGDTSNQNIPDNDPTPFSLEHSKVGDRGNISESLKIQPFRTRPYDYSFDEWLKVKIGHTNIYNFDWEIMFNEWILDSFDVEEEYAKEIRNLYSQRFDEYKRVFDNKVEDLSNEYTLRVGKKGYVLDDVWEKCKQYHKKISILGTVKDLKKSYGEAEMKN
nr:BYPASS-related protein [Tanacetum cinerariifolium]GFA31236.1 BYPASS-related protein [Tanacetum cinerariifolium]